MTVYNSIFGQAKFGSTVFTRMFREHIMDTILEKVSSEKRSTIDVILGSDISKDTLVDAYGNKVRIVTTCS